MARRRYNGYHGGATARDVLKLVAALLTVLLVLAGFALMIGQRYIVYTDDGVRLELPFFQREATSASASKPTIDPEVIQLPKPEPEALPEDEASAAQP